MNDERRTPRGEKDIASGYEPEGPGSSPGGEPKKARLITLRKLLADVLLERYNAIGQAFTYPASPDGIAHPDVSWDTRDCAYRRFWPRIQRLKRLIKETE